MSCPFCVFDRLSEFWSSPLVLAIRDPQPASPGHTLVLTRRHVPNWFDATGDEQREVMAAIEDVKAMLDAELAPDGYNVGFNAGAAAGQTVMHLHIDVIPRFASDLDDLRGGMRHVIPGRGNALRSGSPFTSGGTADPLAAQILPLFGRAHDIRIVAAFVQEAGVIRIRDALQTAILSGARLRLITGDYLNITQASALELLLGWQAREDDEDEDEEGDRSLGVLETRVVEVAELPAPTRAFHPKSWIFEGQNLAVAYVGSSNLSRSALDTGIEWNLRVERDTDGPAYGRIGDAFERLWNIGRPLDRDYVAAYARRARTSARALPPGELKEDRVEPPAPPHSVQCDALAALHEARFAGRRRALVVMATGLGKTWLAAFDYEQLWNEIGRAPRLLFVAHRIEILRQAALTWRRLVSPRDPDLRVSFCVGDLGDLSGTLVFASIAKLARMKDAVSRERFDYVVIDEVHHATADSYRVLDQLEPLFRLGLTATPERADRGNVLALFDDFIAFRAGIGEGIAIGRLVPFRYFGVKDDIDYEHIPWRKRRFEPVQLAAAAQTEARMATLWHAWNEHPGTKTLVFCCSITHALYVRDWLRARQVRVAAVFARQGSDDREASLAALERGDLDAICSVDVFNEGIDLPMLDRVVMLRPTESSVVFLQQLGRGLRAAVGKVDLTVIDFVGNHRLFIDRLHTLLSLGTDVPDLAALMKVGHVELGDGCSVELELEAKPFLEALLAVPRGPMAFCASFDAQVMRDQGDLILALPAIADRPETDTEIRLPDGAVWVFAFEREQCTAARPAGTLGNQLSDLLFRWFGSQAGEVGTAFSVRFVASPDGLWAEPGHTPAMLRARNAVLSFPDLRAAAGQVVEEIDAPESEYVVLPVEPVDATVFAVRVAGTSMDGGARPLRDGDWALMRRARGATAQALMGQVALVELPGLSGNRYQIKRIVRRGGVWFLESDNAAGPTFEADESMLAVARLERVVRPEELAPAVGIVLAETSLEQAFGLEDLKARSGRYSGHLFIFVADKRLESPTRLRWDTISGRPGETAYVLASVDSNWRYLGVAHRIATESLWAIPETDFDTVRRWGKTREVSRMLPAGAESCAQRVVAALMRLPPEERLIKRGATIGRILGMAPRGGLRIAGPDGGFAERTVSLTDLAWVSVAADLVRADGGVLDEARVNKARYLDGTPKASTRWIDTGWAIAAWTTDAAQEALEVEPAASPRSDRVL